MVLTIDMGNSTISLACFDGWEISWRDIFPTVSDLPDDMFQSLIKKRTGIVLSQVFVSSVVPHLDEQLKRLCHEHFGLKPVFLDHRLAHGITFSIDNPAELGADRIAACLGALHLRQAPLIVIDSGTATTFDLVDANRVYLGGAIAPGLNLLLRSLSQNTAKLLDVEFELPKSSIAKNTRDHIRVGAYHHFIGGIERLTALYRAEMGLDVTVIASGGAFRQLPVLPKGIDIYETDLVHIGLRGLGGDPL